MFFAALTAQEKKIAEVLEHDNIGWMLKSAISEVDWHSYNFQRDEEKTAHGEEYSYLLQIGLTRFVQLALKMRPSFDLPVVAFVRHPSTSLPTLDILSALGIIEHGRRVAQSISAGVGEIEQISDLEFRISLPEKIVDDEHYERTVTAHHSKELRRLFTELFRRKVAGKIQGEVEAALEELVYPWNEHFIGYGATPLLDEYFFSIAYAELQAHEGVDSFSDTARFGGIEYRTYIIAISFIVAIFIRHERFAEALARTNANTKMENILTITSDTPEFLENLVEALNSFGSAFPDFKSVNLSDAKKVFAVLSVSRENLALLDNPGCALPLLVQSSEEGFIRSLTGGKSTPVKFLLDSLRYHFAADYDRNQQSREKSMQLGLARVLNSAVPNLLYRENIKIRVGEKILTDIDAVVIDERAGIVFLCQLKYQELYGNDLHSKLERTTRLKEQVAVWLAALDRWEECVNEASTRATLRIPRGMGSFVMRRIIISRHYAYPLKDLDLSNDTTYANWAQFFNAVELVKKDAVDEPTLQVIFDKIRGMLYTVPPQEHEPEPRSLWKVDDLVFVIDQKGSETRSERRESQP